MSTPPWITLSQLLDRRVAEAPDAFFVDFEGTSRHTRAEIRDRADALAASLLDLGLAPGERIATVLPNCLEQILLLFACARTGLVFVPLNAALGAWDLEGSLAAVDPAMIVVLDGPAARRVRDRFPGVRLYTVESNPAQGPGEPEACEDVPLLSTLRSPADPSDSAWPVVTPDMPIALMFTGGTSGLPKAVVRPHLSYIASAVRYGEMLAPRAGDVHISVSQLYHGSGQEVALIGPLYARIGTSFTRAYSTQGHLHRCRVLGGTLGEIYGVMLEPLLQATDTASRAEIGLRALVGGTAGASPDLLQSFETAFDVAVLPVYASTESGMLLFSNSVEERRPGSAGHARGWCDVRIADEHDRPLPAGEVGQILLRPSEPFTMGAGYHGRPDATLERFRNLWLHTGDLGRVDSDGWLYFEGRESHFLRRKGENISVLEVEQFLSAQAGIIESCLVGIDTPHGDQETLALVVSESVDAPDVVRLCQANLAPFKVPDYVVVTATALPRSATKGEIERHRITLPPTGYRRRVAAEVPLPRPPQPAAPGTGDEPPP